MVYHQQLINMAVAIENEENIPLPTGLSLLPYQVLGVTRLLYFLLKSKCAYLADEQGLGKTIQTIATLNALAAHYMRMTRIVIVCPASLRLNWKNEILKWCTLKLNVYVILSTKDLKEIPENWQGFVIVSYDLSHRSKVKEFLTKRQLHLVVFDEAQYLKNEKAARTKFNLGPLWKCSEYKLCLSGTPIPNTTPEAYSVFSKMLPGKWHSFWKFAYRYSNPVTNRFGTTFKGGKNLKELGSIARSNFMVRRVKKHVLKDLPDKIYQTIELQVDAKDTRNEGLLIAEAIMGVRPMPKPSEELPMATMRRELGLKKVPECMSLIVDELEHNEHLVVFAYHKDVIAAIMEDLSDRGIACASITGETKPEDRQGIVDAFQSGELRVLVGNIIAAGTGITLTRANTCIFVELDWTPGNVAQAIDRLHRIGQKDVVRVLYLVAKKTMDEAITGALRAKVKVISEVMNE